MVTKIRSVCKFLRAANLGATPSGAPVVAQTRDRYNRLQLSSRNRFVDQLVASPAARGRRRGGVGFALLLSTVISIPAWAGPPFELSAVKTKTPPTIDGSVHDTEWQGAPVASDFIQYEPRKGEASAFKTEVFVLYDDTHVYVAFRAWDSEPPVAQLTRRDADLSQDDAVAVMVDSFHDRQSAYYFATNLLGTQSDGRVADDGRTTDESWDAAWRSAGSRTEFGWTAEIAIPLTSIKYVSGEARSWGINFLRSRRRSLEISAWAGPLETPFRVSEAGALVGLSVPAQARRHQIIPYGLTRVQEGEPSEWDAGLDVRYAITPRTSVYGTAYPDFATIEADREQVNLTRFELSLIEKRQFFLEGQELFGQRIRTFYTRRIADITAGGKLLGKEGPWTLALLSAQSEPLATSTARANYTVARAQRDVFGRSNVSVMAANRRFEGLDQGSVSLDSTLFFSKTLGMTAQLVKSYGRYGRGSMGYFFRPSYDSATGHFHVRYTHLGDRLADNANVIGFIRDDDHREFDSALDKTLWIRSGPFERIGYGSNYNIYWGQTGTLRSWQVDESVNVEFRNKLSTRVSYTEEFKQFEKDFRNHQLGFAVGYNTREYQSVRLGYEFGRNFDADYRLWTAQTRYKVTAQLSAEYELERLRFDPDPSRRSTWIHVVRANQFFTKDLFLRVFFQTNSVIDRRNLQAVFVYRYQPPFGTIQVAYQRGTAEFGRASGQGHTLFLKLTTVL